MAHLQLLQLARRKAAPGLPPGLLPGPRQRAGPAGGQKHRQMVQNHADWRQKPAQRRRGEHRHWGPCGRPWRPAERACRPDWPPSRRSTDGMDVYRDNPSVLLRPAAMLLPADWQKNSSDSQSRCLLSCTQHPEAARLRLSSQQFSKPTRRRWAWEKPFAAELLSQLCGPASRPSSSRAECPQLPRCGAGSYLWRCSGFSQVSCGRDIGCTLLSHRSCLPEPCAPPRSLRPRLLPPNLPASQWCWDMRNRTGSRATCTTSSRLEVRRDPFVHAANGRAAHREATIASAPSPPVVLMLLQ